MEYGVATVLTDDGVDPALLARTVEDYGFECLMLADHTHVPASRESPYPHPPFGDLPRRYYRTRDPLVSIAAMGAITTRLKLGTGICLVVERDPITLAKEVATLDHILNGRFLFGVGAGWNREEMRNHGTDPRVRMEVMRERVEAMKEIWTKEQAEYHGNYVNFDPIFSWPKPVQTPHPPVLVGGSGPTVLDRVLQFGDGWMPGHQRDLAALGERIEELRRRAAEMGRSPVSVTIFSANPKRLDDYEAMGVDRAVFLVDTSEADAALGNLAAVATAVGLA
ncbi:LLM class F420-dependent oxidoreductase [Sphingomonas sp. AOB5]|uniref:LLM class F420-dependent oxidoreductase n=1 Tax=Sphingomonas sp. AOB5 TaxID=3034017 RepID=UPI0023F9782C|nr:LLM class F420-dependent oxidoreductase [Sphingomonas sp. AOB5]MDF7774859.1 LLM class F420-dependent oxidoreductase [Sphingomonas sp. AOB5]